MFTDEIKIPIHSRKYKNIHALIDKEDYCLVSKYRWNLYKRKNVDTMYAVAGGLYMHRLILGLKHVNEKCDHKDKNGLNNKRNNLRNCTHSQNMANRKTRYDKNVAFGVEKRGHNYRVRINMCGKQTNLTTFTDEYDAAIFYDWVARIIHGEFARQNFTDKKSFTVQA